MVHGFCSISRYLPALQHTKMEGRTSRSFTEAFGLEFDAQEDCDVTFVIDDETIGAHKLMLKVRSQGLYELIKRWEHEKTIPIESMDFRSFKSLLRYIYCDEISLSEDNVFIFLFSATHYKMEHLEERCVDFISTFISEKNLWMHMNESFHCNSKLLQEKCCRYFSKETERVLQDESFVKFSQPGISALLDVQRINVIETVLFEGIRKWMEHQCEILNLPVNGENMREVIGDALFKIRFPTMTLEDFANNVTTINGFLTHHEMSRVFQVITVIDNKRIVCPFPRNIRHQRTISFLVTAQV